MQPVVPVVVSSREHLFLVVGERGPAAGQQVADVVVAGLVVCALLVRDSDVYDEDSLRYVGFRVPDDFLVGYGLDVAERFRNLTEIRVLDQNAGEGTES